MKYETKEVYTIEYKPYHTFDDLKRAISDLKNKFPLGTIFSVECIGDFGLGCDATSIYEIKVLEIASHREWNISFFKQICNSH